MEALFWLTLNILSILMLAFYSMTEMASVSFNKVRLQYYVSKGMKQAVWLNYLLQHPSRLFGTTLIGVNVAMFFGSEFARQFHSAIGLDPDWSPLSQVIFVVIFGELAPMFAARKFAEHVGLLGIPLLYFSAKLITPLLFIVDGIAKLCQWMTGQKDASYDYFLTQEELKKIIEEKNEQETYSMENDDFNAVTENIFSLGHKIIKDVMDPIPREKLLPGSVTVGQFHRQYALKKFEYCFLYHKDPHNIIGLSFPRNLIRVPDGKKARDFSQAPWFVTQNTKVTDVLRQFRKNNQEVAVIVDETGNAVGVYDLKDVLDEIFGETKQLDSSSTLNHPLTFKMVDKTLPGDFTVGEFEELFGYKLSDDTEDSLSALIVKELGHQPDVEESVHIGPYDLTIKEIALRGIKTVHVKSRRSV